MIYAPEPLALSVAQIQQAPQAEYIRTLRAALAEAAQVIVRCIGEDAKFSGDVELYASNLLEIACIDSDDK